MKTLTFKEIQQKAGEYSSKKNNIDYVLNFDEIDFIYNFDLN